MNRFISSKYILVVILLLSAVLRLWNLSGIPPGLTPDEASLGYNAYSILKTGRDEYGEMLPIIFKSFGDYKPGLYVYLAIPFVASLGLSELSIRLPSVIAGLAAVWLIYKIVEELTVYKIKANEFSEKKVNELLTRNKLTALAAAFLLAVSPWHVHFSRGAWEANVSLTFTLTGIYLFIMALKRSYYLVFSALFFALTLLTYQGAKFSTLIVIIILLAVYRNEAIQVFKNNIGKTAISFLIALIVSFPILLSFSQGKTGRLAVFSVFSYPRPAEYLQDFLDKGNEKVGDLNYYIFHSETLNFSRGIFGRYFNHFSSRFLLFEGDWQNPVLSAPYQGMLLMVGILFLMVGLYKMLKIGGKGASFTIAWLLLAPLPAVLSKDQVQAVRALNMVIPLTIISGVGLAYLVVKIKSISSLIMRLTFGGALFVLFLVSFIYFLDAYFVHLPKHNQKYWFYGYREVVNKITAVQYNYDKIIFQQSYSQPYIYFLFYQNYDPAKYQQNSNLTESQFGDVGLKDTLDNIAFEGFSWRPAARPGKILYVGDSIIIPENLGSDEFRLLEDIRYPNGIDSAFRIVERIE